MRFLVVLLLWGILVASSRGSQAADLCIECEIEQLQLNTANRTLDKSIDRLKKQIEQFPNNRALHLLLATAYHNDDNSFWAMNGIYQWLEANPYDCEAKSFLIWFQMKQGDLDTAGELLSEPECPKSEEMKTRWVLLAAYMESIIGNPKDAESINAGSPKNESLTATASFIRPVSRAHPEDRVLWNSLWKEAAAGRQIPLELKIAADVGYTSNGSAGSPSDAAVDNQRSAVGKFELHSRFIYPTGKAVRPTIEATGRLFGLGSDEMQRYSYMDLFYRPGLLFGRSNSILVAYRGNALLMATPGQKKFYEAHRLELEIESQNGLLMFGGVGKRIFKQNGRTRTELDGGIGATLQLNRFVFLLGALNGKYYNAIGSAYDLGGLGLVTFAQFRLPAQMRFRTGIGGSFDFYFHSGGERGENAYGTIDKRRDFTVLHFDELWAPPIFESIKIGIRYEYNHRDSTADLEANRSGPEVDPSNYDYLEHRFLVRLNFSSKINPFAPRIAKTTHHIELNYGINTSDPDQQNASDEIAELLREDEAARASSSCVE